MAHWPDDGRPGRPGAPVAGAMRENGPLPPRARATRKGPCPVGPPRRFEPGENPGGTRPSAATGCRGSRARLPQSQRPLVFAPRPPMPPASCGTPKAGRPTRPVHRARRPTTNRCVRRRSSGLRMAPRVDSMKMKRMSSECYHGKLKPRNTRKHNEIAIKKRQEDGSQEDEIEVYFLRVCTHPRILVGYVPVIHLSVFSFSCLLCFSWLTSFKSLLLPPPGRAAPSAGTVSAGSAPRVLRLSSCFLSRGPRPGGSTRVRCGR